MDGPAAVARITRAQSAFEVIATLMLTAYLFPRQATVTDGQQFDFIVVGGGSSGAVVASRLAQAGQSVLLVEAGGDPPIESLSPALLKYLGQSRYDWNYTNFNDKYTFQGHRSGTVNLTTGHVLGGGSSINFMYYVRGCPADFTRWAAAAKDDTWDYPNVLPYFIRSERLHDREIINSPLGVYHGTHGFLGVTRPTCPLGDKILEAFGEVGNDINLDINADRFTGYNQPMFTISDGVRQSTAYTILSATKDNKNLHVLKNTFVNRIIFDENNNAIGVEATTEDNTDITLRARKEVIVTAGSISTSRLLMISGIGPRRQLEELNIPVRSDLPVGKNLQDHPNVVVVLRLGEVNEPTAFVNPHKFPTGAVNGYVALNKSDLCPDYQTLNFIVNNDPNSLLDACAFFLGFKYEICQEIYNAAVGRLIFTAGLNLLHPKSRGEILLRSGDPKDPPVVITGYLSDKRDLETFVDSLIDYVRVLNSTYFKSVNAEMVDLKLENCREFEYWSRDWWRCYARTMMFSTWHYSGTCSLGSVVDSHLRVFGVHRLRVADASIMPYVVGANTNAATIMIAEKAVDFIRLDHFHDLL